MTADQPAYDPPDGGLRDWRRPSPGDWLRGASAILALTFDLDAESAVLARSVDAARDLSTMSHRNWSGYAVTGSQGRPWTSSTKTRRNPKPCLAAVAR